MKLFSVITVCYNVEDTIESTLTSTFTQDSDDYEVIIVDGDSTDHTLAVVDVIVEKYEKRHITSIKSEKDEGIYDAMNKAIAMASGKYCIFMNAGDTFHDNQVLKKVKEFLVAEDCDLIYGNTMVIYPTFKIVNQSKDLSVLDYSLDMPYCHQSVFIKRDVLKEHIFHLDFLYAADYRQCVSIYKSGCTYKKIDVVISNYEIGGKSEQNQLEYLKQKLLARNEFGYTVSAREEKRLIRKMKNRILAKKVMPDKLITAIRRCLHKRKVVGNV